MSTTRHLRTALAVLLTSALVAPYEVAFADIPPPTHDALYGATPRPSRGLAIQHISPELAAPTPLETGPTSRTWRADDPAITDYLIIGSSMMTAFKQDWGQAAYDLLASRVEFRLDARGCRSLIGPSCSTSDAPPPPNTIDALKSHAGEFDRALVIVAGANDHDSYGEFGIEAAMTTILDEATRQGIRWVIWTLYREVGPKGPRFVAHNKVVREVAAKEPRFVLADWNAKSKDYPASWFNPDGIHLGTMGAVKLAELLADTLDLIDASGPGTTLCRLTRTPTEMQGAEWSDSSTWSANAFAARATTTAARLQVRCLA